MQLVLSVTGMVGLSRYRHTIPTAERAQDSGLVICDRCHQVFKVSYMRGRWFLQAVVALENVSKNFGAVAALKNVSIHVQPSEIVALLGPNGAGKTTAIAIMLGLRRPTTGSISLLGLDPRDERARSASGVMLQESGVPGFLRVREILNLFRSYYPQSKPTDALLALAGLGEKANALINGLSGGQKQRLYFALAMAGDPQVLFLDEPTVGLDVEGRRHFWQSIRDFAAQRRTVLLTTHYIEEADELASRVLVIDRGRIIADATPRELKATALAKRVSFDSASPPPDALLAQAGAKVVERSDSRLVVLTDTPEVLLKTLITSGVEFHNLEVIGATLEEAFVKLTAAGADG